MPGRQGIVSDEPCPPAILRAPLSGTWWPGSLLTNIRHNAPYIDDEAGLRVHERSTIQRKPWCSGAACRKSSQPVSLEIQTGLGLSPASKRMEPRRSTPKRLFDRRKTWLEAACIFVFYSLAARRRYFRNSVAVYSVLCGLAGTKLSLLVAHNPMYAAYVPGLGCDTVTYGPFPHTGLIRAGQGYQVPCSASLAPGTGYGGKYRT
ncbi:hypothetical protein I7I51_05632 [Histoplasma capsulatum]|uniref:Uncharacterized protein n=1 Tax=Ajellomyces capsulatus TaxID=5037 RepID=A0A8A1M308_AJECA|nr:predicted protein [Histoplasma mississippiense (nom. inval.)]EDN06891.1 predicted protein [Histoplasma mississippiense (nom. inval.)]QSS60828.1 hypothetical protein I7I51_05632 [Histoplasma capsulatum]